MLFKRTISFLLLLAFAASTFSRVFVVADYYTNTSAYAKDCINKAKPKLQCNGKCQMMKRLQQEDNKDQQNPDRKMENKGGVDISSKSFFSAYLSNPYSIIDTFYSIHQAGAPVEYSNTIFHPPGNIA
ncbi:MAG: hypothetical protein IPP79_13920 [Chitinophagaceae bacterium]|nr:hypothetical protein [Chitinophagaceae bacterium]